MHAHDDPEQVIEPVGYDFGLSRRSFVQVLGAGLIIAVGAPVLAQERHRRGGFGRPSKPVPLDARLHIAKDGTITVMTGKVEAGQGARAEITQAAAEELGVALTAVQLLMADTTLTPDDGITAGSRTTPSTIPSVRQGCAAARKLLVSTAAKQWNVAPETIQVNDGAAVDGGNRFTYADLASQPNSQVLKQTAGSDVAVTSVEHWKILGAPTPRPNGRDIVTGAHQYPFDVVRPGMLYGKILRPPAFRSKLKSVDLDPAKKIDGAIPVRDGDFVGVVAPTSFAAKRAVEAIEKTAQWDSPEQPSSTILIDYLRNHAQDLPVNPFADLFEKAAKKLDATYSIPYVQHAPLEPRAAVAEWKDGALTVWTGTQNPFGVRRELASACHLSEDKVRVIVPDFGAAFGGKHTGETAIEAARLAQAAKKPVAVRWTRQEEFTWAYFRPAGVMTVQASLDADGNLATWHFVNINSGPSGLETPYRGKSECKYVPSDPPLRHGSYRALAATANHFARESAIDELAHLAGRDPLEFRLTQIGEPRLKAVLETAAKKFDWTNRRGKNETNTGVGLACGTEKGSFVAACAKVSIHPSKRAIIVNNITQAFECGAIINPSNLRSQVTGAMIQALGPTLREASDFENGKITNASFWQYQAPRFKDLPELDVELVNRPDLPSAGAGETPAILIPVAVANAVFNATGERLRQLPLKLSQHA